MALFVLHYADCMNENENTLDALTKYVVTNRIKGLTFEEISEKRGIPVEDIVVAWENYVETRTVMSPEEHRVLYEIRMEDLLQRANDWMMNLNTNKAEDFELILKILKQIEEFRALNAERKTDAQAQLEALTMQQTQLVLKAMFQLQQDFKQFLQEALEQKTIKAIKATVLESFDTTFADAATKALSTVGENDE